MLRSAHMLGNEEEIIFTATDLLADTKLAPELSNEAHYYRAKAYLDAGKTDGAMEDLKILAKTPVMYMERRPNIKSPRFTLTADKRIRRSRRC